ncbi:carboxypeptidase-like regulatory domain-containing protein [Sphingobacterium tabacisoli]|uniref:Carboxypeptidase-like regulatory domain-containing protein n=1 Tax=Sphingobacterium tabacisoli TaxID=2044855 RepID=A0ABW5KWI2_9SPHI|nr:carboxypeptidase-like regulatory domain-containing protein [Sphingobacterium tabacisoli]
MRKLTFDIAHLRKYVNGELSSKEMHEIERATHDDEMLTDILMGLEIEKNNQSTPLSLADISDQITERTQQRPRSRPLWNNNIFKIAASVVVLLTATGVLFWNTQKQETHSEELAVNDMPEGPIGPSHDRIAEISATPDSVGKLYSEPKYRQQDVHPEQNRKHENVSANLRSRNLTEQEKQILAYTPTEKNIEFSQDIAGTLNLGHPKHESDVIIINTEAQDKSNLIASSSKKQAQPRIADTRVSINPNATLSAAQMRAKLSNMGLEPQTNFISAQVLDQQSKKPLAGVEVTDIQNDRVALTDADGRFTYLANNKQSLKINAEGYTTREIATENGAQTILLSPKESFLEEISITKDSKSSKSTPLMGREKYMTYLRNEINKITEQRYAFTVQIALSKKGDPDTVTITKSSDESLNAKVIRIITRGPHWTTGSDWKKVTLEISSL